VANQSDWSISRSLGTVNACLAGPVNISTTELKSKTLSQVRMGVHLVWGGILGRKLDV
jgi:hypothetical protein